MPFCYHPILFILGLLDNVFPLAGASNCPANLNPALILATSARELLLRAVIPLPLLLLCSQLAWSHSPPGGRGSPRADVVLSTRTQANNVAAQNALSSFRTRRGGRWQGTAARRSLALPCFRPIPTSLALTGETAGTAASVSGPHYDGLLRLLIGEIDGQSQSFEQQILI